MNAKAEAKEGALPETSLQVVERAFRWFNDLGARKSSLDRSDVGRLFSAELTLMIEMKVVVKGTDATVQRMKAAVHMVDVRKIVRADNSNQGKHVLHEQVSTLPS